MEAVKEYKNPNENIIPDGMPTSNPYKYALIFIVLFFIFLSFLGINIFIIISNSLIFSGEIFIKTAGLLGYTAGDALNSTADVVTNVGKSSLDVTSGAVHSLGDLLKVGNTVDANTASNIDKSFN